VELEDRQVRTLMTRAAHGEELTVDLEAREAGGFPFELDEHSRTCILEGLDEIALTLQHEDAISAYEAAAAI
jgi:3-isopropylmalate/(R)-2-methylmalate dehydratase small subunit